MKYEYSTSEIIAFKKRAAAEVPGSTGNIDGVDKIFYMKSPGFDATISGSGTVLIRDGWGITRAPTRYGNIITADKVLRASGYKPYPLYANPDTYRNYEVQHRQSKKQREQQQLVFSQVASLPKQTKQMTENYVKPASPIEYQSIDIPSSQNGARPVKVEQKNPWAQYLQSIGNQEASLMNINNNMAMMNMNENQFANLSYQSFGNVQRAAKQLQVPGFNSTKKSTAAKKKIDMKKKKGGAQDEFSF